MNKSVDTSKNKPEEGPVVKAVLEICDEDGTMVKSMQVGFNPAEYSISRTIPYKHVNGVGSEFGLKDLQFMKANPAKLSVNILIDDETNLESSIAQYGGKSYNAVKYTGMSGQPGNVKDICQYLAQFMHYESATKSTPLMAFSWGDMRFIGKLTSITTNFVLFHRNGSPSRAKVSLSILGEDSYFVKGGLSKSGGTGNSAKEKAAAENILNPRTLT